jgi:glycosyltransferase involved in cell wall biosynthesis/SAM-dependent methyltransferase
VTAIWHHDLTTGEPRPRAGPAVLVLWWRDLPLGQVEIGPELPSERWLRWLAARAVAPAVLERLHPGGFGNWLPGMRGTPSGVPASALAADANPLAALDRTPVVGVDGVDASDVSVVVCTRDRPDSLARALRALTAQVAPPGEIVVVDNAPSDGSTRSVVQGFPGVRYVLERRPGLSVARNTGIRASHGAIVAFTDDDAAPHPTWTGQVARAMQRPEAPLAMTGLALPAALDSEAAKLFEELGSFGQGYVPRWYGPDWFAAQRSRATPVWKVGAGVDMAFRREAFGLVGGFDERLGAGATGCSEDSEVWYRLLARGHGILYEPAAVVHHHHRDDMAAVHRQLTSYAEGHLTALFVQFSRSRNPGELRRALVRLPLYYGGRLARSRHDPSIRSEVKGYLRGLRHWQMATTPLLPPAVTGPTVPVAPRAAFLRSNPYPRPLTEGLFYREKMKAIHRIAPHEPVGRVLEIGGGRSGLATRLFPGARVTNLDLDPAYGADRTDGSPFVAADATRLPFPTGAFDVVTLFDVLEHIEDDRDAAREALRVVRPGGWVLASSPNESWRFPYHAALRRVCPAEQEVMAEWGHVRRGYRLEDLDDLFGRYHTGRATFITPVTVVNHDLAFSKLPRRVKRAALWATAPVVWTAAWWHRPGAQGTETAAAWRAGEASS